MSTTIFHASPEHRRITRIRRSALISAKLHDIEMPNIHIPRKFEEFIRVFQLVYTQFAARGYIHTPHPQEILYNLHSLLPQTCIFTFRSRHQVLSTLSFIPDSDLFGLPMDALYRQELDCLRMKGRRLAELGSLASDSRCRGKNFMMYLFKAIMIYSLTTGINDLCLMINPKHRQFYADILLCTQFGQKKFYPRVGAPAIAMHINTDTYAQRLEEVYGNEDRETNLAAFFLSAHPTLLDKQIRSFNAPLQNSIKAENACYFFAQRPELRQQLTKRQTNYLNALYPSFLQTFSAASGMTF